MLLLIRKLFAKCKFVHGYCVAVEVQDEGMSGVQFFFALLISILGLGVLAVVGAVVYGRWKQNRRKRFYWSEIDRRVFPVTDALANVAVPEHSIKTTWRQPNPRAQKTKGAKIRDKLYLFFLNDEICLIMKQSSANLTGKHIRIYHRCSLNVTCLTSCILYALTFSCHWGLLVCSFVAGLNCVEGNAISTRFNRDVEIKITVFLFFISSVRLTCGLLKSFSLLH